MEYVFVSPDWFFSLSIILEVFFAVITMLVSIYAYKVYKLSSENHSRYFSWAFLCISLSYVALAILNFLVLNQWNDDISGFINLQAVYLLTLFGTYAHALLFITGLVILTYLTLKTESAKVLILLLSICIATAYFYPYKIFLFYLQASVLLFFTVLFYFMNYIKNRKANTLISLIAMIFLLFGTLHFMFAVDHAIYYVIGHVLEFIAYMLLLVNLIRIWKHGKKKR